MQFIETAVVGGGVSMTSSTAVELKTHRVAHPTSSVAIVGPGLVGVTTAYALLLSGVAPEIVLIGRDKARVEGNVHDLMDAALYSHPTRILCGDYSDCATADVVVVSVGVPQNGMKSRLDDLRESAAMLKEVVGLIARQAPKGVLLIASNPVDVLTHAALKWSGLPASRVIGSGTTLDSSRFRRRLGRRYGVATQDVHACIVGEHGDSQVALLSSASIAGMPLRDFCHERSLAYEETALADIAMSARTAGLDIVRNKGATNYGIAAALTRIISAILRDEHAVLTVSSLAPQELRLGSVCLSLPAIVSREGICGHLPLRMDDGESEALCRSAGILKRHLATLNLPP